MSNKFFISAILMTSVYSFMMGILMTSNANTSRDKYNTEHIKEIIEANQFKKECLESSDKCIAVIDELLDRNADTGVFDNLVDSLEANGYYKYHSTLDSLYQTQL